MRSAGGREPILLRVPDDLCPHRILVDVRQASYIRVCVCDAPVEAASCPHVVLAFEAEREAAFDELNDFFQRDIRGGGEKQVKVVRHDDEAIQTVSALQAVALKRVQHEFGCGCDLKEPSSIRSGAGDHECAQVLGSYLHPLRLDRG